MFFNVLFPIFLKWKNIYHFHYKIPAKNLKNNVYNIYSTNIVNNTLIYCVNIHSLEKKGFRNITFNSICISNFRIKFGYLYTKTLSKHLFNEDFFLFYKNNFPYWKHPESWINIFEKESLYALTRCGDG